MKLTLAVFSIVISCPDKMPEGETIIILYELGLIFFVLIYYLDGKFIDLLGRNADYFYKIL